MTSTSQRFFSILCGLLLIIGGVILNWSGSGHPSTDFDLPGNEPVVIEYWRAFAEVVVQRTDWSAMHTGILVGPVLWALGAVGAGQMLRARGERDFSSLGSLALAMGGVLWVVTFVFDGIIAVDHAETVVASGPAELAVAIAPLRAAEHATLRLGLVAWILIGVGVAAFAYSLIVSSKLSHPMLRWGLGVSGILLGLWPLVAMATGLFLPGPFTSPLWLPTVVLTSVWFSGLGVMLMAQAFRRRPVR